MDLLHAQIWTQVPQNSYSLECPILIQQRLNIALHACALYKIYKPTNPDRKRKAAQHNFIECLPAYKPYMPHTCTTCSTEFLYKIPSFFSVSSITYSFNVQQKPN